MRNISKDITYLELWLRLIVERRGTIRAVLDKGQCVIILIWTSGSGDAV